MSGLPSQASAAWCKGVNNLRYRTLKNDSAQKKDNIFDEVSSYPTWPHGKTKWHVLSCCYKTLSIPQVNITRSRYQAISNYQNLIMVSRLKLKDRICCIKRGGRVVGSIASHWLQKQTKSNDSNEVIRWNLVPEAQFLFPDWER